MKTTFDQYIEELVVLSNKFYSNAYNFNFVSSSMKDVKENALLLISISELDKVINHAKDMKEHEE